MDESCNLRARTERRCRAAGRSGGKKGDNRCEATSPASRGTDKHESADRCPRRSKEKTLARRRKQRRRMPFPLAINCGDESEASVSRMARDRGHDAGEEVGVELHEPALAGAAGRQKTAARLHICLTDRSVSRWSDSASGTHAGPAFSGDRSESQ